MASSAHALHILVKHRVLADDILEQLKKGAKFQDLAKKHSTCPSGKKGGDLGEFSEGAMVPQFDKAVFSGKAMPSVKNEEQQPTWFDPRTCKNQVWLACD